MRAIIQQGYGSADVLRPGQVPRPAIKDTEVLVKVHAAGVDRGAWHIMTGRPLVMRLGLGLRTPRQQVPGREIAGTVVAVGAAVTGFSPGDEVFGTGRGAFAEFSAAPEGRLARKPANATFEQAAAVPVSGVTALQALTDVGRVEAGQRVLVLGASGGVGSFAVQLAKAFGAEVTGVCSTGKLDLVRSLGADHVIDYTRADFADGSQRYDLILDIAGNPSLSRLRRALTPTGTAVIAGGEEGGPLTGGLDRQLRGMILSRFGRQRLTGFIAKEGAAPLARLAELIDAGKVTPHIDRTYTLEEAPDALRRLDAGAARGKLVVVL